MQLMLGRFHVYTYAEPFTVYWGRGTAPLGYPYWTFRWFGFAFYTSVGAEKVRKWIKAGMPKAY